MAVSKGVISASVVLSLLAPPVSARIAVIAPEIVGPRTMSISAACPSTFRISGGQTSGPAIPVPALRLGAPVLRATTSFPTGGSGTAAMMEMERRRKAGLQYEPRAFDTAAAETPFVFANTPAPGKIAIYQRLPLKTLSKAYSPYGMVFAHATAPAAGRIVSLMLVLPAKPATRPKLTVAGAIQYREGCRASPPIQVFASATPINQLRKLFGATGCTWTSLDKCDRSERPRGRILFVQLQRSGVGYEHRWVDYDLLLGG